jgi:hypothetical protein
MGFELCSSAQAVMARATSLEIDGHMVRKPITPSLLPFSRFVIESCCSLLKRSIRFFLNVSFTG